VWQSSIVVYVSENTQGLSVMIKPDDCCLIVENNFVILLDLEDMVQSSGFKLVDQATSLAEALSFLKTRRYRVVFLDLNLGTDNGLPIAQMLKRQRVPFAITSAYYDESNLPPELHNVPIVAKPYSVTAVNKVLAELLGL
jgi:two-component SAPR family response regulator